MTPDQCAAAIKGAVYDLGGAFSNDARTMRRVRELGLTGWAFYVAGRGGALGDVRVETVAAAMGFIAPTAVRDGWDAARRVETPQAIAAANLAECCRWGVDHLAGAAGLDRFVELAERVVVGAEAAGMPLFAAWRMMPIPDDRTSARAAVLFHLLREHRGGAHLLAIRASALTPIEAVIAGPDGEAGATAFGWQPPYPPYEPLIRRRAWAEALTDRIAGEAYRALDPGERDAFAEAVESLADRLPATG